MKKSSLLVLFRATLLSVGAVALSRAAVSAGTYYISPYGNDGNTGRTEGDPKKTFSGAFSAMSAGDELVLLDGDYSVAAGTGYISWDEECAACGQPKSGAGSAAPTVVRAKNPGNTTVDGGRRPALFLGRSFRKDSFIRIEGITFEGGGDLYNTHHVVIRDCGFHSEANGGGAIFGIGTNDGNWGNSYNLVEDCWIWGNSRIIAGNYRSDHNVWRRVVIRGDGCDSGSCSGGGNPNVGFTVYNSSFTSVQNVIIVDRILKGGSAYGDFATAQHEPGGPEEYLRNNEWLGCVSLKSEDSGYHFESDHTAVNHPVMRNCVAWDNGGANFNLASDAGDADHFVIENLTAGLSRSTSIRFIGPSNGSFRNIVSYKAGTYGVASELAPSHTDVYGAASGRYQVANCSVGCLSTNPMGDGAPPSLKHVLRIEEGSLLSKKGAGNGVMGAVVVKRYGADGTHYGDAGYNQLTSDDLWPWPNQDRIKADLCAGETRGFCGAASLTGYVWSYLGAPSPYAEVPAKTVSRPAAPMARPPAPAAPAPIAPPKEAPVPAVAASAPKAVDLNGVAAGDDDLRSPQKTLSLPDGAVTFGPAALDVAIHDKKGDLVFEAKKSGSSDLVWSGKDSRGKRVEPGLYISRIRGSSGKTVYQPITVVK